MSNTPVTDFADIVRVHGRERPTAPALEFRDRTVTFGQLDDASSQLAQAMRTDGVRKGDRVAFLDKNSIEYFEVFFAIAKLGAVVVAVNWRLAPAEMAQIINDSGAAVVIVGSEFIPHVEQIEKELSTVRRVVVIGDHSRWERYTAWAAQQPAEDPGTVTAADDVALQLYTSGTTGLPKGVMISNGNFFAGVMRVADQWHLDNESVSLAMMPLFHIAGAGWAMVSLAFGCRTVLVRDIEPTRLLELIPRFGVTNALMVPAVIQALLTTPEVESTQFSTLRAILYGASPITDKVLVQALDTFGCELIQVYGLTETTGAICQLDGTDHDPDGRAHLLRSCGRPYPWVELRVIREDGQDACPGEIGELWTRSPQNMKGYWNNPTATADAITPDGWFKTGDAGFVDANGFVFLHDRVKDMIVTGGENVYPAEVENALMLHPAVRDVAVIGVPDDQWGEAVRAIVVLADDKEATGPEIIAFARERLAGYKLPKSVDFIDTLPRNPSGKVLKRELREPHWAGIDRRVG